MKKYTCQFFKQSNISVAGGSSDSCPAVNNTWALAVATNSSGTCQFSVVAVSGVIDASPLLNNECHVILQLEQGEMYFAQASIASFPEKLMLI